MRDAGHSDNARSIDMALEYDKLVTFSIAFACLFCLKIFRCGLLERIREKESFALE